MSKVIFFIWIWMSVLIVARCSDKKTPDNDTPEEKPPVADGYYRNPIAVDKEDEMIGGEGIADPATFRWMGKYYLLSTQYYKNHGVAEGFKVWESTDLVTWNYKTAINVNGFIWDVLWAPEMYYYRGAFYIYLSGPGGKMAAWKYELPHNENNPEPFGENANWVAITHDFLQLPDHAIDGSILIEPNGDKYAFFSGMNGIKYRKINSMEDGNGEPMVQLTQCVVDNIPKDSYVGDPGWTESPTAFKKDGNYYLTYTGNHYLRPDYQIHLAVGSSIDNLTPIAKIPWISNLYGEWTGTGNCYPIIGPNLKDYYYSYHAKEGARISPAEGIHRRLMIDKVEFKSNTIETKAPTFEDEPIPEQADFDDDFSNGLVNFDVVGGASWTPWGNFAVRAEALGITTLDNAILSKETTGVDFVAESYVRIVEHQATGVSGVIFIQGNDISDINIAMGIGIVDGISKIITFDISNDWQFFDLPDEFSSADWTDVRVEKIGNRVNLFVNNVDVMTLNVDSFGKGKVGYMCYDCNADVVWTAFSNY